MNETNLQDVWEVDINGDLFEANMEILAQWITEGTMMPQDRVRRGKLRWIEAKKVPALLPFFNAFEQGLPTPTMQISTNTAASPTPQNTSFQTSNSAFKSFKTSNFQIQPLDFQSLPPTQNFVPPTEQYIPPTENFQPSGFNNANQQLKMK